jgi:hypothetical protein
VDLAILSSKVPFEEHALSPGKPPNSIGKFAETPVVFQGIESGLHAVLQSTFFKNPGKTQIRVPKWAKNSLKITSDA